MNSPDKVDNNPQAAVENIEVDKTKGLKDLIDQYGETFCKTSLSDIERAVQFPGKESGNSFNLPPNTYVSHQGLTILSFGDSVYITRNPLALDEIKKAGLQPSPLSSGNPLANADMSLVKKQMPYIGTFLSTESPTNEKLERNRKIELVDKDAQYMNAEDFEKRYGFAKEKYEESKYQSGFLDQISV